MKGSKAIGVTMDILMFPPRKAPECQTEIKCEKAREETRLQAAGCKTTPKPSPLQARIIPFPGVTLTAPDDDVFQTQLDGFLREMGYIE